MSSTPPGHLRLLPGTGPTPTPPPQYHPGPPTTEAAPDVSSDLLRADREEMTGRLRDTNAHLVHHSLVVAVGRNGVPPVWRLAVPLGGTREAGALRVDEPYCVTTLMRLVHGVGFPMATMVHPTPHFAILMWGDRVALGDPFDAALAFGYTPAAAHDYAKAHQLPPEGV
ncbi:DUF6302 family protein [Streptomyces uncialis]|uniref:DUF6302 family protein n=1 Tax=Streptomyces uncialis TaxID=1048205 RepID=UPI0033E3168B